MPQSILIRSHDRVHDAEPVHRTWFQTSASRPFRPHPLVANASYTVVQDRGMSITPTGHALTAQSHHVVACAIHHLHQIHPSLHHRLPQWLVPLA